MNNLFRNLLALLLLLSVAGFAQAQPGGGKRQQRLGRIENAKIAYLTDKLSLTQDQAQRFWPVYNEFSDKRRDLNRRQRLLRTENPESLTDQQLRDNLNQMLANRQTELNLEKEYLEKFQKVISLRQVAQLFIAEREFTKVLLQRLNDPRGAAGAAPGMQADD
ncbi:hypothetical protein LJY25_08825 [Hymenobacter sp. BT175]|uniref:hypothetical protein n=1 Tax=Hymenobacter translucens TaxID=2886507 RepID=UPI001D0E8090|nr:hypothetical protein [Hymenobacter translucens]MCC2546544.1 hypothetical protein [Hymenobacter translucens]